MTARTPPLRLLEAVPLALLAIVLIIFGAASEGFLTFQNAAQILAQAAPIIIVGVGMTFVLLTAGVDLSVGAIMFVGAGLAGHLAATGQPLLACAAIMIATGVAGGALNGLLVSRFGLVAFVATLATLYVGRGLGRWITGTRAMNLPDSFLAFGTGEFLAVPVPVWIAAAVALAGQFVLSSTPFGRQLYALGANRDAARKAGVDTARLTMVVYVISGGCAGLGGLLALSRLGAVSPRFGELYEFEAITAAVLGGTSLYGGRGRAFPGTVIGALLVRTIFSGLVSVRADPYLYPLITAAVIFLAVLVDSLRVRAAATLTRGPGGARRASGPL